MLRSSSYAGVALLLLALAFPGAAQTTFSNSTAINFNSNGLSGGQLPKYGPDSSISVSGLTGTLSNISLTLYNVAETYDYYGVTALLTGPGGRRLVLFRQAGFSAWTVTNSTLVLTNSDALIPSSFSSDPNTTITHRPTAYASPVQWTGDACGGNCPLPETAGSNTLLGIYGGMDPNGTWTLSLRLESGDETLNVAGGWSLTITTASTTEPTTTTVDSSLNPSYVGDSVTFTATVAGSSTTPSEGTVDFTYGATTVCGSVAVSSGVASCITSALPENGYNITATYSGTSNYGASSDSLWQVVKRTTVVNGTQFCNPTSIVIPESGTGTEPEGSRAAPYASYMDVSLGGIIGKVTVELLDLTHTASYDVDMMLVSPAGQKLVLFSDVGGANAITALDFTLDDDAATLLPDTALSAGTYKPTSRLVSYAETFPSPAPSTFTVAAPEGAGTLALFNGQSPTGEWQLFVMDQRPSNSGSLGGGWCLNFTAAASDLTINKSHTGNFRQGGTGSYSIVVTNSGAVATAGTVTVTDTPDAGLTITNMSGSGWTCTAPTCTRSDSLASSNSYPTITVTVDVASDAAASLNNVAEVSGGGDGTPGNNSDTDPTTIDQVADLTVTKSHSGNFTEGQDGATYSVVVRNSGAGPTTGTVTLTETAQTGFTLASMSGTGWNCGTLPDCTRTDAWPANTDYPTITVTVNVDDDAPSSFTNSVTVSGGGELDTSNNIGSDPTTVIQLADLTLSKTHTGNFRQGQTGATYTLTVTNDGDGASSGTVTVTEDVVAGLTITGLSGTNWSCNVGTRTCTRSDALAASASYETITVTVNVASDAAASITNTASVSGGGEIITTNNTASDPTTVTQVADLEVAKTHSGNFRQGQTGAQYTITVSNTGPGPTDAAVTVTDTLPAGLTATAISGTGWTCTLSPLACNRNTVLAASGSYPDITLTVDVATGAASSVTNNVSVSGGGEIDTSNNTDSDVTTVDQAADLTVTKTHTGNFSQGQTGAQYTITVTNSGPGSTVGTVAVVDTLPTGLTATAMSGTGWSCTLATRTCTSSSVVNSGDSFPAITLTVTVASDAAASVANNVAVSGGGEFNTSNNTASDPTTVVQLPNLTVTKIHTGHFTRGQQGVYTITASNAGYASSSGTVVVTDTLPAGLTADAIITAPGWSCVLGPPVVCDRSDAAGAGVSYPAIVLRVNVDPAAGTPLVNSVTVTASPDSNPGDNTTTDGTTVLVVPDITWATPAPITYGTALSATQLNASSSVPGTFAYSPAAGAILNTGSNVLNTTFTPSDPDTYATTTATVNLTVNKATPVITWANPSAISYGTPLDGTQLNASTAPAGTFDYSPPAGSVLTVGDHTLNVTFTPTDTANYNGATASVTLHVDKATPVITWPTPAPIAYGAALSATQLNASTPVAGAFVYAPSAGTVLAVGSHVLNTTFTPTDTANYNGATASVTLVVNKADPVITWPTPALIVAGTPLGAEQLNATANTPGTFVYTPPAGTVLTAGTHTLTAVFTPTDTGNYNNGTATVTVQVGGAVQSVSFTPIEDRWHGDSPAPLIASASSGLPVTFSIVSGPATVNGDSLTLTGVGLVTVAARQEGNDAWKPAEATQSFRSAYRTRIQAGPGPIAITVDGTSYMSVKDFLWDPGAKPQISVPLAQIQTIGSQLRFVSWSDGGEPSHTITIGAEDATYTALFVEQFLLRLETLPGGEAGQIDAAPASPSGFYDAGSKVTLTAVPESGYYFSEYSGAATGENPAATVDMTAPQSVTAHFTAGMRLDGVTDSAGYRAGPLAPGGLYSLFGRGMSATAIATLPLSTSLGGATLTIRGREATLLYVSERQVNFLTPEGLEPGPATLQLTNAAGASATLAVEIAGVAPGLFTANQNGQGAPAGTILTVFADGARTETPLADCSSGTCVPAEIDLDGPDVEVYLVLYGTGLRNGSTITATIGGIPTPVLYAGPQGTYAGLDQVNLRAPRELAGSGECDLVLIADGVPANTIRVRFK